MLKYLFSYSVAERLVKLEHLSISSCKLVEEIFVPDEIMSHIPHIRKSSHVEMVPIFPNLETLVISNMDNFKSIWPNQLTQNSFCKLKKMEITSCDQLLNVFPNKLEFEPDISTCSCNTSEIGLWYKLCTSPFYGKSHLEINLSS
ncbi:hypothetical protein P8452_16986 [Trifolium repens]|nr:hypothetical protein P8452_16986 [Trifolium repens]